MQECDCCDGKLPGASRAAFRRRDPCGDCSAALAVVQEFFAVEPRFCSGCGGRELGRGYRYGCGTEETHYFVREGSGPHPLEDRGRFCASHIDETRSLHRPSRALAEDADRQEGEAEDAASHNEPDSCEAEG